MNETIMNLVNRTSCNNYQDKHVEPEMLEWIVKAGLNAPTGRNAQTPRFVVVSNDEMVAKLSKMNAAVNNNPNDPFYGAKDVIIVLSAKESCHFNDGSLAMGNLMNAAYSLGLGARWINRAYEVFETAEGKALLKEWGIEEEVEGIGFCIVGHVNVQKPKTEIKPGRVFYVK